MSGAGRGRRPAGDAGFTYLGVIILVAIIGLVGAATLKVDALMRRAAAERELLETGAAFSAALRSYADATPRGQPQQPPSLQELLKDPRFPGVRRHLRKIFVDPITGTAEWGIVYAGSVNGKGSGVLAVYSLSKDRPLKVANFDARFQNFENKEHISDWKFAASGQAVSQAGQGQGQAPGRLPSLFPQPQPGTTQAPGQGQASGQPALDPPQPALFRSARPLPPPAPAPESPESPSEPAAAQAAPTEASGSGEEVDGKDGKEAQDAGDGPQTPPAVDDTRR